MLLVCSAIIAGIALLVWSADRFVDGAANVARRCGMPPLLVGIAIVGFGTSAPEMLVSGVSAWQGNAGIALGNAFGSNIANIGLILGVTALISPVPVKREVLFRELPALNTVGYKELFGYLEGMYDLPEAVRLIKRNTRHYAKKQLTWWARDPSIRWIDLSSYPA